jgi:hypothetical protein
MGWRRGFLAAAVIMLLAGGASAQSRNVLLFLFVQTDCPISNSYAPEIQRICKAYKSKGVGCSLAYEDVRMDLAGMRKHMNDFSYNGIPAVIDSDRAVADRVGAKITPAAVVVDSRGTVLYRGRIDNLYASLGKPRRNVTEHDLTDALDAILAGKPVPKPETEALGCFITRPKPKR